jgi:hypothetical protein
VERIKAIPNGLPILTHHDYGRLDGGQHRQQQVEKDVRVWIEGLMQDVSVHHRPEEQQRCEQQDERPGSAERGDPVCKPLAKGEFIRENAIDVSTDQLSLGCTLENLALDIA